jgi:hypothetical protein
MGLRLFLNHAMKGEEYYRLQATGYGLQDCSLKPEA